MDNKTITEADDLELKRGIQYLEFYNEKVSPIIEEIIEAPSYNQRRKLQKKVISVIKSEGYLEEARRTQLMFNV